MSDKIVHINDGTAFDSEVLKSNEPVLVDFWAQWCGPCRALAPVLDSVADALAGKVKIAKVDVDSPANQQIAATYGIRNIPTLLLFKEGKLLATKVGGGLNQAQLQAFIEETL